MAKKKTDAPVITDPFIGGEEDDLMDMEYIQDENTTTKVETHPPETDDEAAAAKEQEDYDPTPPEAEEESGEDVVPQAEEKVEAEAEEEPVIESERVPKSRFDEVNERMKRAEERVKQLEKQVEAVVEQKAPPAEPEPEPYDFAAKDAESMDALLEGDSKRYSQIQEEIRRAIRDEALREAKRLALDGDNKIRETLTFEEAAAKIEADYPQFVEGSEAFNKVAYDELMDLYLGYAQSGRYNRIDAMRKAADKAVKLHNLQKAGVAAETAVPDNVVNIKKTDVATKAKAAERQPPRMEGGTVGKEEPRVDVMSMSDEQYEALPESTKRRLRGDIL